MAPDDLGTAPDPAADPVDPAAVETAPDGGATTETPDPNGVEAPVVEAAPVTDPAPETAPSDPPVVNPDANPGPAPETTDESVPTNVAEPSPEPEPSPISSVNPELPPGEDVPITDEGEVDHVEFIKAGQAEERQESYIDYQTRAYNANVSPVSIEVFAEITAPVQVARRTCGVCGAEIPGG